MVTRLFQPLMFLAAFYAAIASAVDNEISLTFGTGPGQPTRLVLTNQYCMSEVPDVIGLDQGRTTFHVYTNGGFFSKCGWVHSSATFEAQNNKKEKKLVVEFYKDVASSPQLKILWPPDAPCATFERSLNLLCGTL